MENLRIKLRPLTSTTPANYPATSEATRSNPKQPNLSRGTRTLLYADTVGLQVEVVVPIQHILNDSCHFIESPL